jgi:hypothetical protein
VGQWIADGFYNRLIEFRFFTGQYELDFLACLSCEVTDKPRKPAERRANRQHADAHDALLDFARVPFQLGHSLQQHMHLTHLETGAEIAQHRLRNDQFAHQVDELVDLGCIYANGRRVDFLGLSGRLLLPLFLEGLFDLLRSHIVLFDQDLPDSLLLSQGLIQRFTRHHTAFDENFAQRLRQAIAGFYLSTLSVGLRRGFRNVRLGM